MIDIVYKYSHLSAKKEPFQLRNGSLSDISSKLFLVEEVFCFLGLDELLSENISAGLGGLVHTDALDHALSTGLGCEGCNGFLCHNLISFNFNYLISR